MHQTSIKYLIVLQMGSDLHTSKNDWNTPLYAAVNCTVIITCFNFSLQIQKKTL